jgi:hypothetical protein
MDDNILGYPLRRKAVQSYQFCRGLSMNPFHLRCRQLILAAVLCLACQRFVVAADEPTLTKE